MTIVVCPRVFDALFQVHLLGDCFVQACVPVFLSPNCALGIVFLLVFDGGIFFTPAPHAYVPFAHLL